MLLVVAEPKALATICHISGRQHQLIVYLCSPSGTDTSRASKKKNKESGACELPNQVLVGRHTCRFARTAVAVLALATHVRTPNLCGRVHLSISNQVGMFELDDDFDDFMPVLAGIPSFDEKRRKETSFENMVLSPVDAHYGNAYPSSLIMATLCPLVNAIALCDECRTWPPPLTDPPDNEKEPWKVTPMTKATSMKKAMRKAMKKAAPMKVMKKSMKR